PPTGDDMAGTERLQGKAQVHDLDGMAHPLGNCQVHQPALREDMDLFSVHAVGVDSVTPGHGPCVRLQPLEVDLNVEMPGIRQHRTGPHYPEVPGGNHRSVPCGGDEDLPPF